MFEASRDSHARRIGAAQDTTRASRPVTHSQRSFPFIQSRPSIPFLSFVPQSKPPELRLYSVYDLQQSP